MTLIGYRPLNENSGEALDHSGNSSNGVSSNVSKGVSGLLDSNCYDFNGSDSYVSIEGSLEVRCISLWINSRDTLTTSNKGIFMIGQSSSTGFAHGDWTKEVDGEVLTVADGKAMTYTTVTESENQWLNIVYNWNGSTYDIYVNGQKRNTGTNDGGAPVISYTDWRIGYRPSNNDRAFNGKISEVRIYDRPLTKSEVQYLYSVGKRGLQTTGKKSS